MRVLVLANVYPPEPLISAATSFDVAGRLRQRGHDVTVVAPFPNRPRGIVFDGFRRRWRTECTEDGCRVVHRWHSLSRRSGFISRAAENLTFGATSSLEILGAAPPDVAYMSTWPVFAQGMNLAALRLSKVPIVCAVKDIYPESLIDKGMLNPRGVLANGLMHLNRLMLRRCDRIVTLSPGMADLLVRTRRLRPSRVIVVPNWVDAASYPSIPATESVFRREHGIPEDAFVAMFAGSLTLSSGAMLYVEVAQALESYRDLQIVLVGDGSLRDSLARAVAARRLTNIRLISPLLPADVPAVQASADVLLLSLAGGMSHSAAPSKQVAYLFSGRPILANVPGDSYAAQIIRDAECGEIVPPNDHQATAAVLLRLSRERASLLGMGLRARKLAEATFSRSLVLPKLVRLIEMVGTRQVRR